MLYCLSRHAKTCGILTKLFCLQIGEDFEERDDEICGCVLSTRPRTFRLQVWVRDRDAIDSVNGIGKRIIRLLELDDSASSGQLSVPTTPTTPTTALPSISESPATTAPSGSGISFEFQYHKGHPATNKFISIGVPPVVGGAGHGSKFQSSSSAFFNKPPGLGGLGGLGGGGQQMQRSTSDNSLGRQLQQDHSGLHQQHLATRMGGGSGVSWRERLGQPAKKREVQQAPSAA